MMGVVICYTHHYYEKNNGKCGLRGRVSNDNFS